jgi:hypothetical protein
VMSGAARAVVKGVRGKGESEEGTNTPGRGHHNL